MGNVVEKMIKAKNGTTTEYAIVLAGVNKYEIQRTVAFEHTIEGPEVVATLKTLHGARSKLSQITK